MASKTNATPQKEEVPEKEKEGSETPSDSPLLDLLDAAVKKLNPAVYYRLRRSRVHLGNVGSIH